MRLEVVVGSSSDSLVKDGEPVLALAASVEAHYGLAATGRPSTSISRWLKDEDYHGIWRESALDAWGMVRKSTAAASDDLPDPAVVTAYSTFIALAQIRVMALALDRIREVYAITSVAVEVLPGRGGDARIDWGDASLYADVTLAWAADRMLACEVVPSAGPVHHEADRQGGGSPPGASFLARLGRLAVRVIGTLLQRPWRPPALAFTQVHLGMPVALPRPWWAPDLRLLSLVARFLPVGQGVAASWPPLPAHGVGGWIGALVNERWRSCVATTDIAYFRRVRALVAFAARLGLRPTLMATAPFHDCSEKGMTAEAFRLGGGVVAEVAHGVNCSFALAQATPAALAGGMADLALEWAVAESDECRAYGIATTTRRLAMGSLRSHQLTTGRSAWRLPPGARPLALYAPTILDPAMIYGGNVAWDQHVDLLDRVLAALDSDHLDVVVSYLPTPEMPALLNRHRHRRLTFRPACFGQVLPQADFVVAEAFGGSPIYETLTTTTPGLCFTGLSAHRWDQGFLETMGKRFVLVGDPEDYVAAVEALACDPAAWSAAHPPALDAAEAMARIIPPIAPTAFWSRTGRALEAVWTERHR